MDKLAVGFWGCYFGTTALLLVGSAMAFFRSLRRIAINGALSAVALAFLVLTVLGGLPIDDADRESRFLAHLATFVAIFLFCMLFALLGLVKSRRAWRAVVIVLSVAGAAVLGVGWLLPPLPALALSMGLAYLLGVVALGLCLRGAIQGDRLSRVAIAAVGLMLCALIGLGWIALDRAAVPWQVHALSAIAATLYVSTMAWVLWARYAYLIELHEVMAHGPSYDPVTRMRSHAETGQLVGSVFKSFRDEPAPLGVMVLTIANLYSLEKLHGSIAINHALFVTAGRLRRVVPGHIEMGRLGHDGFLLLMRNCKDSGRLIRLARTVEARLRKPLSISTSRDVARIETHKMVWGAEVGVGLLLVSNPEIRGSSAIPMARGMSRTAMSYASRIAWFDHSSGEIVELPVLAPA
jgi:GGDEF domain-containing protein